MELKELILSTLKELDEKIAEDGIRAEALLKEQEERVEAEILSRIEAESAHDEELPQESPCDKESDEVAFLEHMRERLLVLFEGLQAEETKNIEAKLDITLNFLEYHLAKIEERLEEKR
jgi:hypothetical protein